MKSDHSSKFIDVIAFIFSNNNFYSSFIASQTEDAWIHLLSDGSGYYVSGMDSSNRANIWKYIDTL